MSARTLLILLAVSWTCFAGSVSLSLAPGSGVPGSTVSLDLTFDGGEAGATGLQWSLTYASADIAGIDVLPGPAATSSGKSVWCLGSAGVFNCLIAGFNNTPLESGVVAQLMVQTSAATSAASSTIGLSNVLAVAAGGESVPASPGPGAAITFSGIQCTPSSLVTPVAAVCTVAVSGPAPSGGSSFGISSTNSSLSAPASVTIAAGARKASFNRTAARVSAASPATVTATLGGLALSTDLVLAPPGTTVAIRAVTNAADYLSGPVAPGEMVTIFGSGLGPANGASMEVESGVTSTTLAGTRVMFDGTPAPLLFVRSDQVNAVTPYGLASGANSTQVQIEYKGVLSKEMTLPVDSANPAIFTAGASGTGQGVILNEDGTHNSAANSAKRNSIVTLYATGAGLMVPTLPDGTIATTDSHAKPVSALAVWIDGVPAEVLYAGAAENLVTGAVKVKVRVPAGIAPGPRVPVVLTAGGFQSPAGVTVAVQ